VSAFSFIAQPKAVVDRDTDGNPVPTYKAHAYTYDGSGNLQTDTVTDGATSWVRTYMWSNGAQTSDSGWVKQ
jgi:YD repeat-containing protein